MTHERTLELLDDFVGGEMDPREERDLRRHLMECDGCRAEERALRALLAEAAALPAEIEPARDLWEGIAGRLPLRREAEPAPAEEPAPVRPLRPARRALPPWLQAAAAVVLVVASSLATLHFAPRGGPAPVGTQAPMQATPGFPSALAAFRPVEEQYEQAIGELMDVLELHRDRLAPQTVATVEESLRIIDEAIAEARVALARDPASPALARMLAETYNAKLGVLRRAVQL
jgi:hypothetical protein